MIFSSSSPFFTEKSIISFSSLKKKKIKNRKKGKTRYELLFSKIDHLYIGFVPMCFKSIHKLLNKFVGLRKIFPTTLSSKRFVHSSIFLATKQYDKDNDSFDSEGLLIEYGVYFKHSDEYEYKVFYPFKNGLRFTEMNLEDFKTRMNIVNEKTNNIPFIKCKVNSSNNLQNLILRAIFENNYDPKDISFFYKLFCDRNENNEFMKKFDAENYNLLNNNCQDFVAKIIKASYATIDPTNFYSNENNKIYEEKLNINKIDYSDLKYYVPPKIVEALEINDKIIAQRKNERKTTIVETNYIEYIDDINKNDLEQFDDTISMKSITSINEDSSEFDDSMDIYL